MSEPIEVAPRASGAFRISVRTAAIMLAFTLVFTALMAGTYKATAPLVAASTLAEKLRLIGEVLPPASYDNDLMADAITLPAQKALGLDDETRLWRARKDGAPVALVLEAAAPDGYSGRIGLIVAVGVDGRLIAVRVTTHKETPGLGDYINPKKDRNKARPWITQFSNLGFDTVPREQWRVKKDGGRFDQMSGATISARAVTNASGRALAWTLERRDTLFALPANGRYEESKP
ncbi:MAG: electron transport complex subunit RsxG [Sulfuritalea sp.]|nr:electron transport complex subunit RsxG [Sulfuritalea sp.]